MSTEQLLSVAVAVFAFGTGTGEYLLESVRLGTRRFGRCLKIGSTFGAGCFALSAVIWPDSAGHMTRAGVLVGVPMLIAFVMLLVYWGDRSGSLKPLDD